MRRLLPLVLHLLCAAPAAGLAAPTPAELVPASAGFFAEIDLSRLRDLGPKEQVARLLQVVQPRLAELGIEQAGLRAVVVAGDPDEALRPERRSGLLILDQGAAAFDEALLSAGLRRAAGGPLAEARYGGQRYQRGKRLSFLQLPGGPAVFTGAAGPRAIIDRWNGKAAALLEPRGAAASLMLRAGRAGAVPIAFWLRVPVARQKELGEQLPAVPREIAGTLLPVGPGADCRAVVSTADPPKAQALAGWLKEQLQVWAGLTAVQLMGLSGLVRSVRVSTDGPMVLLYLPLTELELAGVLDRASGLLSMLAARPLLPEKAPAPPVPAPRPSSTTGRAGKKSS